MNGKKYYLIIRFRFRNFPLPHKRKLEWEKEKKMNVNTVFTTQKRRKTQISARVIETCENGRRLKEKRKGHKL